MYIYVCTQSVAWIKDGPSLIHIVISLMDKTLTLDREIEGECQCEKIYSLVTNVGHTPPIYSLETNKCQKYRCHVGMDWVHFTTNSRANLTLEFRDP